MGFELFSQGIIGLDIGTSSIKAIKLKKTKSSVELVGAEMEDLSAECVEDLDPDTRNTLYINTIKKVLKQSSIKGGKVVTSISGDAAMIRYTKVPYMDEEELKNMIPLEAEQYIPLGMDQVSFDYNVLGEIEEGNQKKLEILLVAVKNDTINQHLSLLKEAGVEPIIIDVDAFALSNSYVFNLEAEEDQSSKNLTIALINIGAKITTVNILENGISHMVRDLTIGGNNFTKEIQREFNLNFPQAEELKKEHATIMVETEEVLLGSPSSEDNKATRIFEAITPALNKLLNDIRRSFDYYESSVRKKPVQKILLSGGTSKIKNLDRFLAERLGVPVEINYPFKNINISSKNFDFDYLRANAVHFNVALGLALREGK